MLRLKIDCLHAIEVVMKRRFPVGCRAPPSLPPSLFLNGRATDASTGSSCPAHVARKALLDNFSLYQVNDSTPRRGSRRKTSNHPSAVAKAGLVAHCYCG